MFYFTVTDSERCEGHCELIVTQDLTGPDENKENRAAVQLSSGLGSGIGSHCTAEFTSNLLYFLSLYVGKHGPTASPLSHCHVRKLKTQRLVEPCNKTVHN